VTHRIRPSARLNEGTAVVVEVREPLRFLKGVKGSSGAARARPRCGCQWRGDLKGSSSGFGRKKMSRCGRRREHGPGGRKFAEDRPRKWGDGGAKAWGKRKSTSLQLVQGRLRENWRARTQGEETGQVHRRGRKIKPFWKKVDGHDYQRNIRYLLGGV